MKRRTVQVNLALLGLAALWGYLLAGNQSRFEAERRLDPPGPGPAATVAFARPASPAAAAAAAVADNHLFHPDRNNDLPEESSEAPQTASLPLPVLMGTLGIGREDYALMVSSDPNNPDSLYRRLKAGQTLDGYTLTRVETDGVVMRSGAGEVRIGINNKRRKGSTRRRTSPRRTSTRRPGSASTSGSRRQPSSTRGATPSKRRSSTFNVPVGTVRDGKRLIAIPTPFGDIKRWVEHKQDKQE